MACEGPRRTSASVESSASQPQYACNKWGTAGVFGAIDALSGATREVALDALVSTERVTMTGGRTAAGTSVHDLQIHALLPIGRLVAHPPHRPQCFPGWIDHRRHLCSDGILDDLRESPATVRRDHHLRRARSARPSPAIHIIVMIKRKCRCHSGPRRLRTDPEAQPPEAVHDRHSRGYPAPSPPPSASTHLLFSVPPHSFLLYLLAQVGQGDATLSPNLDMCFD